MRLAAWVPVSARPPLRRVRTALRKVMRRLDLGGVSFGDLDRTSPIGRLFGFDRGLSVDRWYVERFLRLHAVDIRGRVLEVADSAYTARFGGAAVTRADVLSRYDADRWAEWWRFTRASLERLLAEQFGSANVQVQVHGNVKTAVTLLHGLACEDIRKSDLEAVDADYELVLTARAVRA